MSRLSLVIFAVLCVAIVHAKFEDFAVKDIKVTYPAAEFQGRRYDTGAICSDPRFTKKEILAFHKRKSACDISNAPAKIALLNRYNNAEQTFVLPEQLGITSFNGGFRKAVNGFCYFYTNEGLLRISTNNITDFQFLPFGQYVLDLAFDLSDPDRKTAFVAIGSPSGGKPYHQVFEVRMDSQMSVEKEVVGTKDKLFGPTVVMYDPPTSSLFVVANTLGNTDNTYLFKFPLKDSTPSYLFMEESSNVQSAILDSKRRRIIVDLYAAGTRIIDVDQFKITGSLDLHLVTLPSQYAFVHEDTQFAFFISARTVTKFDLEVMKPISTIEVPNQSDVDISGFGYNPTTDILYLTTPSQTDAPALLEVDASKMHPVDSTTLLAEN